MEIQIIEILDNGDSDNQGPTVSSNQCFCESRSEVASY